MKENVEEEMERKEETDRAVGVGEPGWEREDHTRKDEKWKEL